MKASPEPLCSPNARIAPCPWCGRAARPAVRSVQHGRVFAQRAVGIDQRALWQFLAAAACDQHLAFGDDRGREIEHDRILPLTRNADAIRRGRQPLLDAAIGRHQQRAGGVDEMHRHQAFGGGHLRPVADAADMAGVAQRDRGKARLLAFLDADPHRLRRHRLAVAELAVDHRERRRIDHDLGDLVGNHRAHFLPADIDRYPDHAVAVMAGEIGGREIGRDAPGFFGEDSEWENTSATKSIRLLTWMVTMSGIQPCLRVRSGRIRATNRTLPRRISRPAWRPL